FGHVAIDIGRGQAEVPLLGADQLHAIVADRLVVTAHHEMQFVTSAGQHQPVEAADGTGTYHCNPHNPPPTGCWKPSETIRLDLYKRMKCPLIFLVHGRCQGCRATLNKQSDPLFYGILNKTDAGCKTFFESGSFLSHHG